MSDTPQTINGELLRLKRESLGWLVSDLATRACMSTKQIRQLEEGGASSFYSESVKLTSAKKVGAILGLTADEVFGVPAQHSELATQAANAESPEIDPGVSAHEPASDANESSNGLEHVEVKLVPPTQSEAETSQALTANATDEPVQNAANSANEQKNKTPLGAIAALFVAALAVAAWMRPEAEPVAVEPPPPLQTLPAETPEGAASTASAESVAAPAGAASTAASGASAAPLTAAPASSAATAASASASKPL